MKLVGDVVISFSQKENLKPFQKTGHSIRAAYEVEMLKYMTLRGWGWNTATWAGGCGEATVGGILSALG